MKQSLFLLVYNMAPFLPPKIIFAAGGGFQENFFSVIIKVGGFGGRWMELHPHAVSKQNFSSCNPFI